MTNKTATDWNENSHSQIRIAYAGLELKDLIANDLANFSIAFNDTLQDLENYMGDQSILTIPDIILVEVDKDEQCFELVNRLRQNFLMNGLIIVMLSTRKDKKLVQKAMQMKLHDFYTYPFATSDLRERLNFLVKFKLIKPRLQELSIKVDTTYKMPFGKRFLDLAMAGGMFVCLIPVMAAVAIAIKLDSKGPVFYKSKRVGTGYKIFDFYKFRSMRTDADQLLAQMAVTDNQYAAEEEGASKSAFVKIKNDPRITKLGSFLRSSSLDELPQLFNIIRGDMSVVGNRPLPVYEAEMLTSNEWSMRFLGPAGLTGLWQISKRGKEDMSERERKKLDNFYAQKYSLWLDLKIIVGTVPALFQKEKV
ncbi:MULTISPECIES: sugar transferase [unclassified Mucilaginibacter]|uniref:sugar transferase n=1 Tax=unclassified Mucilaginibacter TaxID=2617802 RepID=UPI002AC9A225|nr:MULTISPECIES: sugar transferase [unclassified Mucilaginibacter]MEB0261267.1 sugar transferase [Mucilaginibacter sp. 10I4]MEB0279091.1 sugar transferase [Mucilaginibacter sp. 10B2]MEB0299890.1 sugar transferase [Mucilaginibacter sp. 5C4]WPX22269.1 sugar transferase [Mucilaginibacter sp. 5C4]